MQTPFIERCENCKFSLTNIKDELECRVNSPQNASKPYPITSLIDWCGRYIGMLNEDVPRKENYLRVMQEQVSAAEAKKKADLDAKKRAEAKKKADNLPTDAKS